MPTFILKGSILAGISSLNTDMPPLSLGVIASNSWAVGLAIVAVAAHLCILGRDGHTQIRVDQGASKDVIEGLSP